ncbi:MAG: hypothetical protein ACO1QB_00770 [Verrucomicrobiales bacterium]
MGQPKSFKSKAEVNKKEEEKNTPDDPGNPTVDFHGDERSTEEQTAPKTKYGI